ncbi:MAG: ferrous iron transporter B [Deltaproteobacteria bacterium]|nr:ferrous iron transporter B [Deltaproteobacteria bacterium]
MAVEPLSSSTLPSPPTVAPAHRRVALMGNPNTGKTTLFNRLSGLRAKTANFPGTTSDARIGSWQIQSPSPATVELIDLPGLYRIHLDRPESKVCSQVLRGEGLYQRPDALVVVVDASNLLRNLFLVGELLPFELPTVVALNMVDIAQRRGLTIDAQRLSERLGCPVVPIIARAGIGLEDLESAVHEAASGGIEAQGAVSRGKLSAPPIGDQRALTAWAEKALKDSVGGSGAVGSSADTLTERLDQAFTHPILGVLLFAVVMGGLFWTLFALATVPMDLIEATFGILGGWLTSVLPSGAVRDLLVDGVVGGVAGTVVFLPQICLLFFLISLLEDTGYMARAAFVMDRILCRFGLPGHAFVPLLSSHACALPGIMATKLIPDPKDRLATILVAPFMSCSARLPVYVLLTSLLFSKRPLMAGLIFAGCYLLGASAALLSAFLARRTFLKGRSMPMVLELPSYKRPSLRTALYTAYFQGKDFLHKAGTLIVGVSVVMWWLSAYPQSPPPAAALALEKEAAAIQESTPLRAKELQAEAAFLTAKTNQAASFAGRIGRAVQPLFAPLGYDWQLTVGVLTSFLAREVFVSTMAVLLVGDDDPDLQERGVLAQIRGAKRDDGSLVFTPATAASLLVFFVLAMQCLPTLALTGKQTGSWKWAGLQLIYMSSLAYVCALVTFHGLRWAGIS